LVPGTNLFVPGLIRICSLLNCRPHGNAKELKMSDMFKVYQNYSNLYDELVNHEDYENNLCKFLNNNIQWDNKVVGEFGIGTGRVTKTYIDKVQKVFAYGFFGDSMKNDIIQRKLKIIKEYTGIWIKK
jgi:hypothetical protein